MKLFKQADVDKINAVAARSKEVITPPKATKAKTMTNDLQEMSQRVIDYFKDSESILIESKDQLHDYIDKCIEAGIAGIDTETTGLDRQKDWIVGSSLYYPGGHEAYIPNKHIVPIFENLYPNQLTYEDCKEEFQRLADNKVKLVFANGDFDLWFIYKDYQVDLIDSFYYDVIYAWRVIKSNEPDNALKVLYNKYCLKGKGDPMKFNDFFSVQLFPYCKPTVAKLYAANDAKITYDLMIWQLPYITKDHPKCKKKKMERLADVVWNIEMPMVKVCQNLYRRGLFVDKETMKKLQNKYHAIYHEETTKLAAMVQDLIDNRTYTSTTRRPFQSGKDFNESSPVHVKYLIYTMLGTPVGKNGMSTDKQVLTDIGHPITKQILAVRGAFKLLNTYVDKLPKEVAKDGRIHAQFISSGAETGRMSSRNPNLQNVPSHAEDIRHMFRATPGYVLMSSDYSSQEPRLTAYVSGDPKMIEAFQKGRDIYATIASVAFKLPYEKCLEFNPDTGEYQADGKARRSEAKSIVLGVTYGRSVPSIGEQLYGKRKDMTDEQKTKEAQKVYDAVMDSFPDIRRAMLNAQQEAHDTGYVETVFGSRRYLPDMMLDEFEFQALPGYVNPDVNPLDPSTLTQQSDIPDRIVKALKREFSNYKYFGQIAKRTKQLYENDHIKVINNRAKINDASRQCLNTKIQGSAAMQTKLAMIMIQNDEDFNRLGGRMLVPIHDEIMIEAPVENAKRCGELLSGLMCEAASFLPFPSKCDVTTSMHWYGLEYPCPYEKPKSWEYMTEDNIKWVQYYLLETEYVMPVFKDADGNKPIGDAGKGVSGIESDEYRAAIQDYIDSHNITKDEFFDHIENNVNGIVNKIVK